MLKKAQKKLARILQDLALQGVFLGQLKKVEST